MGVQGTVYLIHFDSPLKHAKHYIGYAFDLPSRCAEHEAGRGARILAALRREGIGWRVVRTWPGDRDFERKLKNGKRGPRLCPVCSAGKGKGETDGR